MYKILNFALFYLAKTKEVGKEIILQILVIFRIKKKVFLSFCTLFSYIFWSKSRNTCIITSKWYYYYSGSRHVKSMIRPISIPTTYMIFKKKMVKTDIWNLNIQIEFWNIVCQGSIYNYVLMFDPPVVETLLHLTY